MSTTAVWLLGVVLLLAGAVWVGGLVTIAVVARIARRELDEATRVAALAARVRRGARRASVLRATVAVLTLALVALGGALAG